jgi:hypothetical protein
VIVTDKKLEANRNNSKLSTGPRSLSGKNASKRNALKFGLSIDVAAHPHFREEVNQLARVLMLAIDGVDETWAVQAAAAEIDLLRIRKLRASICDAFLLNTHFKKFGVTGLTDEILDRYERRAFARRKRAIANLIKPVLA